MSKDGIAKQIRMEAIVGTFVLLVLTGLAYFTIVLSRDSWFAPKEKIEVLFPDVMGLREGDSVVVRGMKVGKVDSLELAEDGVHVMLAMETMPTLRQGYRFRIVPTSILGGLYLEIDEGQDQAPPVVHAGVLLRGEPANDLLGDASEVMVVLREGLVDGSIISNVVATMDNIREITDRLEQGQGTLGRLLSADAQLYADLSATAGSLRTLTGRLEAGEGTLGKLFATNETLYADVASSMTAIRAIVTRVEAGEGTMGKLVSADDQVYQDLAAATKSLRSVAEKVDTGKGVIGRLMTDEQLGESVAETITEIRATVDDLRETSPVVTFTSIFFGAL